MSNENKYKPGASQFPGREMDKSKNYPEKNKEYPYNENSGAKNKDKELERNKYPYGEERD